MTEVLFLGGAARSGSTVFAQYLEAHLDSVHVGELRYIWTRGLGGEHSELCECRRPLVECPFWGEVFHLAYPEGLATVRERMTGLLGRVDRMRHAPRNLVGSRRWRRESGIEEYGDVLAGLYGAVQQVSGAAVVIDSTKEPSYLFALTTVAALDLRVVHLVRDSRAVAYSWTRKKLRPEIHWQDQAMRTRTPASSAGHWIESNLAMEASGLGATRPYRVRYEDFTADPTSVAVDVAERFSLAQRGEAAPLGHSFSGNPVRFSGVPLAVKNDDVWTSRMPASDRRTVTLLTAPLLWRYGYSA